MSIAIYYDRSYVFGTVLEYAVLIGSCTWHRVYEIYPRRPRAADQFPISQNSLHERCLAARRDRLAAGRRACAPARRYTDMHT